MFVLILFCNCIGGRGLLLNLVIYPVSDSPPNSKKLSLNSRAPV
jgi:hypothetical protein